MPSAYVFKMLSSEPGGIAGIPLQDYTELCVCN